MGNESHFPAHWMGYPMTNSFGYTPWVTAFVQLARSAGAGDSTYAETSRSIDKYRVDELGIQSTFL